MTEPLDGPVEPIKPNPWSPLSEEELAAALEESPKPNADTGTSVPPDGKNIVDFLKSILDAQDPESETEEDNSEHLGSGLHVVYDLSKEAKRTYTFGKDGETFDIDVANPDRMVVGPAGTHYIVGKNNSGVIVPSGWLNIFIVPKDPNKSPFGF